MVNEHESPSRVQVVRVWRGIINGSFTREDAHGWAAKWVEDIHFKPADAMITTALQYLHGFDLVGDGGASGHAFSGFQGNYIKNDREVEEDLGHWLRESAMYDEDRSGYLSRKAALALEVIRQEESNRRRLTDS
jgi:hypothetical protein